MTPKFIGAPRPVARSAYDGALERMVEGLCGSDGIRAIFQVGSVSAPGVSDLDLVVVFEDEATCLQDPRADISEADRYLFIHSLFGTSVSLFERSRDCSFFHNYQLLWGEEVPLEGGAAGQAREERLKAQIALEYLYRMYIGLVLQRTYNVYRIRDLFLHVKAVGYDLDFLGIKTGRLHALTHQLIGWRSRWFEQPPEEREMAVALEEFFHELTRLIERAIDQHGLYLPHDGEHRLARSVSLKTGRRVGYRRRGLVLPAAASVLGARYFKLQNRLNRFQFTIPEAEKPVPGPLAARFRLLGEMKRYNAQKLPHFAILGSSLHA